MANIPSDLIHYHDTVEALVAKVDGHLSLNDPEVKKLPEAAAVKTAWEKVLVRHGNNWAQARAEYLRCYPINN